jgi:chaperonin GroEL (HSP60 family)
LRGWSSNLEGRAQLAVQKFADALDSIPLALAENAGMDSIDTMTELRTKQNKGAKWTVVDVRNTKVTDMFKQDVLEPLVVKEQIIKSATEAASMLLRIDDVITGSKSKMPLEHLAVVEEWVVWAAATAVEWIWSRLGIRT